MHNTIADMTSWRARNALTRMPWKHPSWLPFILGRLVLDGLDLCPDSLDRLRLFDIFWDGRDPLATLVLTPRLHGEGLDSVVSRVEVLWAGIVGAGKSPRWPSQSARLELVKHLTWGLIPFNETGLVTDVKLLKYSTFNLDIMPCLSCLFFFSRRLVIVWRHNRVWRHSETNVIFSFNNISNLRLAIVSTLSFSRIYFETICLSAKSVSAGNSIGVVLWV